MPQKMQGFLAVLSKVFGKKPFGRRIARYFGVFFPVSHFCRFVNDVLQNFRMKEEPEATSSF